MQMVTKKPMETKRHLVIVKHLVMEKPMAKVRLKETN
jgi:hypothetical protein